MGNKRIQPKDIVGMRVGKLTVTQYDGYYNLTGKGGKKHWYQCICDCGNRYLGRRDHLLKGRVKSCGNCRKIVRTENGLCYITSDGESFLFDEEDLGLAYEYSWCISKSGSNKKYVVARRKDGKIILFSRMALSAQGGDFVDHINGNTLDNRRSNLRIASVLENSQNTRIRSDNNTGYKGVGYVPASGKYRAYIGVNSKFISLGTYETPEEAARAYDEAARFYFGEFACVNFPLPGEQGCMRGQETVCTVAVLPFLSRSQNAEETA